jgi:hypothetical protein
MIGKYRQKMWSSVVASGILMMSGDIMAKEKKIRDKSISSYLDKIP